MELDKYLNMQNILLVLFLFSILVCSCENFNKEERDDLNTKTQIIIPEFQSILDTLDLEGAILVYDEQNKIYYSNNFLESKTDYLPASTFKIPNSIIGLELGILEDENTIFKWDSTDRYLPVWEQDLSLKDAFQTSCVPCYQDLARKIGVDNMKAYVKKLNFGELYVDEETIDNFWLIGPSKINAFEQIDFLKRLNEYELAISKSTYETLRIILEISSTDAYLLSGKSGLAINGPMYVGWFVGYVEKEDAVYYFAIKISPKSNEMNRTFFGTLRQIVMMQALRALEII